MGICDDLRALELSMSPTTGTPVVPDVLTYLTAGLKARPILTKYYSDPARDCTAVMVEFPEWRARLVARLLAFLRTNRSSYGDYRDLAMLALERETNAGVAEIWIADAIGFLPAAGQARWLADVLFWAKGGPDGNAPPSTWNAALNVLSNATDRITDRAHLQNMVAAAENARLVARRHGGASGDEAWGAVDAAAARLLGKLNWANADPNHPANTGTTPPSSGGAFISGGVLWAPVAIAGAALLSVGTIFWALRRSPAPARSAQRRRR